MNASLGECPRERVTIADDRKPLPNLELFHHGESELISLARSLAFLLFCIESSDS